MRNYKVPFFLQLLVAVFFSAFNLSFTDPNEGGGAPSEKEKDDFENPDVGENFGGTYPKLDLQINSASGKLEYIKDDEIEVKDDGEGKPPGAKKTLKMHVLREIDSGLLFTSPIGAVFDNVWEEAAIERGDVFRIKRYPDAEKKEGKGKGNKMKIYAVKVYSRKAKA